MEFWRTNSSLLTALLDLLDFLSSCASKKKKTQRHELQPVDITSFTNVKKRANRSDDSILLRYIDDVVVVGPDEHFMIDFEHDDQSVLDVVLLRLEGDTVNCLGLEISKTNKGFEFNFLYTLREFSSLRVGKLAYDSQSW